MYIYISVHPHRYILYQKKKEEIRRIALKIYIYIYICACVYVKKEIPVRNFNRHLSVIAKEKKKHKKEKKTIFSPKSSENGIYLRFFFFVVLFISCLLAHIIILFVDSYREQVEPRTHSRRTRATRKISRLTISRSCSLQSPNDLALLFFRVYESMTHVCVCVRAK